MKKIKTPMLVDLGMNGKAFVIEFKGWKYLQSYETVVVAIDPKGGIYRLYDIDTQTTWRHYNEFVKNYLPLEYLGKNGFEKLPKGEAVEGFW